MNNKEYLLNEAQRLYIYDLYSIEEIADKLDLSTKTICRWKEKHDWENKKQKFLKSKQSFHEELFEFARKLMKDIMSDIDAGEKVDSGRMFAFCKILPMFVKVKDYEDIVAKRDKKEAPSGLTADIIAKIEEDILGIPRKIETEDETDN